tara:strand:- start:42 stop:560 length:519 start_codon:yes stop_codon:yes gene_type:complete
MGTLNLGSNGKVDGNAEFEGRVTKPAHPYMILQPNASVTVNNNTQTLISTMFGTTHVNQGGIALDTSNGRITFPVVGLYRINVKVNSSSEAYWGNDSNLRPKLNGSDYLSQQLFYGGTQNKGSNAWYNPFYLNVCVNITSASDYIELYMYQNSGSNVGLNNQFGYLEVYLIG